MKCEQACGLFGTYWDLPEDDLQRQALDKHLQTCESCAEEFRVWEESASMIREMSDVPDVAADRIGNGVMERIYAEESWFLPVKDRTYQFSSAFRRGAAAAIAGCLAMFTCAFLYLVFGMNGGSSSEQVMKLTGMLDTANASNQASAISIDFYQEMPVASISDPIVLQVVPTVPQYWVALSILGMIMTLLTINWLARTRI